MEFKYKIKAEGKASTLETLARLGGPISLSYSCTNNSEKYSNSFVSRRAFWNFLTAPLAPLLITPPSMVVFCLFPSQSETERFFKNEKFKICASGRVYIKVNDLFGILASRGISTPETECKRPEQNQNKK